MTTITIPTLTTARLTLRAPSMDDLPAFTAFLASDRSRYVGGPGFNANASARIWGHVTGLWVLRGYSSFTACLADRTPIGCFGPWHPATWPEPEFGWTLWDGAHEGQGYVTEAMQTLIPWTWETVGLTTAVAHIHPDNAASIKVATRLGASYDPDAPAPDSDPVKTYRFQAGVAA